MQTQFEAKLAAMVEAAVAAAVQRFLAQSQPKAVVKPKASNKPKASAKASPKPATKTSTWNVEEAAVKAAEKAGFPGAKPRVDLLTAKGWLAKGFRPKAGTKAVRVKKPGSAGKGMPLFHKDQVELAA